MHQSKLYSFDFEMVRYVSKAVSNQIVGMSEAGMPIKLIAERKGVHRNTVTNILRRYRQSGNVDHLPRAGRPRVTTPAQDVYIRTEHLR